MKGEDSKLIWEQYVSPGRSGGGSVPFPDGRGEHDDVVRNMRSPNDVRREHEQKTKLFEDYYYDLIDQHGGYDAATAYTGLTPQEGDSEASQFLNVLNYLIDTMTPEKRELISAALTAPEAHMDVAYELSEMSSDELVGLTDGGTLPF